MKGVNVIESFETICNLVQETRLERGRRLRRERRKRWGMLAVTAMTAFSTTILLWHENTRLTNAHFTSEVTHAFTFTAAVNFCGQEDDMHQSGDGHKDHPPGNGYGHCKPYDNSGNEQVQPSDIPDPPPEQNPGIAPEDNPNEPTESLAVSFAVPNEFPVPPPEDSGKADGSMPTPAAPHVLHTQTPPALD
jgi:hypothetical protein